MPATLGQRRITSQALLALAVTVAAVFVFFSNKRLWHSDLWGHLSYGRWICEQQALPDFEPFMPLARDVPIRCTAWLSQVMAYRMWTVCGHHGLQLLHGLSAALASGFVFLAVWRSSRSWPWSMVGTVVFLLVCRSQLAIIRPQLVGVVGFPIVCLLVRSMDFGKRHVIATGCVFVVWGNMHPSFPAGLMVLAAYTAESLLQWKWQRTCDGSRFWLLASATTLAAVSVLANPYSWRIYEEVFAVSGNPNLRDLLDWLPLSFARTQGHVAFVVAAMVVLVLVGSRKRGLAEIVLLVLAAAASLASARMLNWFAPLAGIAIGVHGQSMFARGVESPQEPSVLRVRLLPVIVGIFVPAIVFSPIARIVGLREPLTLEQTVSGTTPVEAVNFINANDNGMTFAPNTWGDLLVWTNNGKADVLVTSHVHLVPRKLWKDYIEISGGTQQATGLLDRHRVNTVLVNPRRKALISLLEESSEWRESFKNRRTRVYQRITAHEKGTAK